MSNSLEKQDANNKKNIIQKLLTGYKLEWLVIGLYVISYIVVTIFHEPWFDEAQAWQIARCASVKDILFTIPHYEGHPSLWHLIFLIPAKLGFDYEISIKVIGGIIITSAVMIWVMKAPFKRWFKLLLPFTFFFFYQYGIIVRPYSIMLLFIMLAAIFFKKRNEHPFRFVIPLILLCFTSAYGVLISGGITFAWVIEIFKERSFKDTLKSVFTTKRMGALWVLLASALFVVYQIIPKDNTLATSFVKQNNLFERLVCTLFAFLPDSFLTENAWSLGENLLIDINFDIWNLLLISLLGVLIWALIWFVSSKKSFLYFVLPYVIFAVFSAAVYFNAHHIGIVLFIIMFWAWINTYYDDNNARIENLKRAFLKKGEGKKDTIFSVQTLRVIKKFIFFVELLVVVLSIYWSVSSSILDVRIQYSFGREAASFLKDNNLDKLTIFSEWGYLSNDGEELSYVNDVYYMHIPINIYPYFDDDEVGSLVDNMDVGYVTHMNTSEEVCKQYIDGWGNISEPDILLGYVRLGEIYGDDKLILNYSPVFKLETNIIWRGSEYIMYNYIFMRNDLLEEYNLTSLYENIKTKE